MQIRGQMEQKSFTTKQQNYERGLLRNFSSTDEYAMVLDKALTFG